MRRTMRKWAVLAVMVATLAPLQAAQAATYSVALSPSSGPVGATVTAWGTGFPQRSDGVLRFAGVNVASFKTGRGGEFITSFVVPSSPVVTTTSVTGTVKTVTGQASFTVTSTSGGETTTSTTVATTVPATTTTTIAPAPVTTTTTVPATTTTTVPASTSSRLSWAPPSTAGYTPFTISAPGTYNLYSNVDYVISAPSTINGAVHLRGGRNVVWIGGHITIPYQGAGPVDPGARRGLVISDIDAGGGDPVKYGYSVDRIVHVEGLLIDGPDLAEGINTNAPKATLQLQNIRVQDVHFRNADDRDGTSGWAKNHPDVLQIWGSQKELRVDGLTGSSAYQGIYLQEDSADRALGAIRLRRVNIRAYQSTGDDGVTYAGHRMLTWVGSSMGMLYLDPGTVRVTQHTNSGWNAAQPNPSPQTGFWRARYWNGSQYVTETPPGGAVFTDGVGGSVSPTVGADAIGTYAYWGSAQVRDWGGIGLGRVYSGNSTQGDYVPAGSVGTAYQSPGYGA